MTDEVKVEEKQSSPAPNRKQFEPVQEQNAKGSAAALNPYKDRQQEEAQAELEKIMVGHKMIQAEQEIEAFRLSLETERLQVYTLRSIVKQHKEQVDLLR